MAVTDAELINSVKEKDISHIKNALTLITRKDRSFYSSEFDEALAYVKSNGIDIYNKFDGEQFKPESEWDDNYWNYINASLMDNFCDERINLLKQIGKKIYRPQVKQKPPAPPVRPPASPVRPSASPVRPPASTVRTRPSVSGGDGTGKLPFVPMAITAVILIVVAIFVLGR